MTLAPMAARAYSPRQLLAKPAIAASRVASYCVGARSPPVRRVHLSSG